MAWGAEGENAMSKATTPAKTTPVQRGTKPRGRPFPKGNPGRPKGSKNRVTKGMVADLVDSYKDLGGVEYLKKLGAMKDPALYVALLKRLIPNQTDVKVEASGDLTIALRSMTDEELERLAHATAEDAIEDDDADADADDTDQGSGEAAG